jgi:predicted nuclease of predicted toxin-antitoxin system
MSLRFFTDHCVPTSVIEALRGGGHEVLILKQHIPKNSDDADVIAKAQEINAILVSLNGDFSNIVTYPPAKFKGIISLQVQNHPEAIPSISTPPDKLSIGQSGSATLSRPFVFGGITQNSNSRIERIVVQGICRRGGFQTRPRRGGIGSGQVSNLPLHEHVSCFIIFVGDRPVAANLTRNPTRP